MELTDAVIESWALGPRRRRLSLRVLRKVIPLPFTMELADAVIEPWAPGPAC